MKGGPGYFKPIAFATFLTLAASETAHGLEKKPEDNLTGDGLKVAQASDLTRLTIRDILDK